MNSLRTLVVDDEPLIRSGVRRAVSSIEGIEVIGEAACGSEAVEAMSRLQPDLVLLDVQMPDLSGIDVVRTIGPDRMPAVIFVTAYDEYAVKAFDLHAVDYVLKPFDEERLRVAIERARDRVAQSTQPDLAAQLRALLGTGRNKWPQHLVVRDGERFDFVPVDSIDWVESANNYVQLHCGPRQYLLGETLTSLQERLDPEKFLRIHRCRVVNTSRIVAVHSLLGGAYSIELRDGTRLTSGRHYKDALQELLHA